MVNTARECPKCKNISAGCRVFEEIEDTIKGGLLAAAVQDSSSEQSIMEEESKEE